MNNILSTNNNNNNKKCFCIFSSIYVIYCGQSAYYRYKTHDAHWPVSVYNDSPYFNCSFFCCASVSVSVCYFYSTQTWHISFKWAAAYRNMYAYVWYVYKSYVPLRLMPFDLHTVFSLFFIYSLFSRPSQDMDEQTVHHFPEKANK